MIILGSEPALPRENDNEKNDERKEAYHREKIIPKDILLHQGFLRENKS